MSEKLLNQLYQAAIASVNGYQVVYRAIDRKNIATHVYVVAIGKAALPMAMGAHDALGINIAKSIVITAEAYISEEFVLPKSMRLCLGAHPIPNEKSLQAGDELLAFIADLPANAELIFLISGGASSLVEVMRDGVTLPQLQKAWRWLLAQGYDIAALNRLRQKLSKIKNGGLLNYLSQGNITAYYISDVKHNDVSIIGSGLLQKQENEAVVDNLPSWLTDLFSGFEINDVGTVKIAHEIISDIDVAKNAVFEASKKLLLPCLLIDEFMEGDAVEKGEQIASYLLKANPGIYVWGGETTIQLPKHFGVGGRALSLALAVAIGIAGNQSIFVLAASTDGRDGNSDYTGALVTSNTFSEARKQGLNLIDFLDSANAANIFNKLGGGIPAFPSNSNVMDIVIAVVASD